MLVKGVAGKRELNKSMFNVIFEAASRRISRKLKELCSGKI